MTYAVTHNGIGHPDDAFAWKLIQKMFPDIELKRSRDTDIIKYSYITFDVGGIYDPDNRRFDHHQRGFSECRDTNKIPYSSFGLVWKQYCNNFKLSQDQINKIDEVLVQPIDAVDNGFEIKNLNWGISSAISAFNPNWNDEEKDFDKSFENMAEVAGFILEYTIDNIDNIRDRNDLNDRIMQLPLIQQTLKIRENALNRANVLVQEAIENKTNKNIIHFKSFIPWQDCVIENDPDALFAIFPDPNGEWRVQCVPTEKDSFEKRKSLPEKWGGQSQDKLNEIIGINDAVFCHRQLFIAGAKSEDSILKMANMALNM